jgi:hypothetical protein
MGNPPEQPTLDGAAKPEQRQVHGGNTFPRSPQGKPAVLSTEADAP